MKNISSAVMNVRDLNSKSFTVIKRWGQVKKVTTDFLETCMGSCLTTTKETGKFPK